MVCVTPAGAAAPRVVYVGDALHVPAQVGRPEWSPHFDCCCWMGPRAAAAWTEGMRRSAAEGGSWHATASVEQRVRLLEQLAADSALLLSPHFPAPGMGEVCRTAPPPHAAKGGGGGAGRGAGGGGGGRGGGELEYTPLVPHEAEPGAAAAEVAEMVEAVEAVAGMVGGGAVPGGGDTCRPCETWRDGSWAVRAPLVML